MRSQNTDSKRVHLQVLLLLSRRFEAVQSAQRAVQMQDDWPEAHLTLARGAAGLGRGVAQLRLLQDQACWVPRRACCSPRWPWPASSAVCSSRCVLDSCCVLSEVSLAHMAVVQPGHEEAVSLLEEVRLLVQQRSLLSPGEQQRERLHVVDSGT